MKTTKEKIAIMQAYEEGKKIKQIHLRNVEPILSFCKKETEGIEWLEVDWDWVNYDYQIVEEPKQVPFDFTDGMSLVKRLFMRKDRPSVVVCTSVDDTFVCLATTEVEYSELAQKWLIYNETLNKWLPCTKTVNN